MLLGARQFFAARKAAPLPYDAEVEYLESTGTQWIDTGFVFNSNTDDVKVDFALLDGSRYKWCYGSYEANAYCAVGSGDGTNARNVAYGNGTTKVADSYFVNNQCLFQADSSGAYLASTKIRNGQSFSATKSIYLFNLNIDDSTNYKSSTRIWRFSATRNGVLVRDIIPVRKIENGVSVGYMYDKVSGRLFGNQGTGAFTIGPDKYVQQGYIKNGLVAMWDGIENAGWGVHDANATVWKDLVGSNDLDIYGGVEANCVRTTNTSAAGMSGTISGIATIECCCKINPTQSITIGLLAYSGNINTTNLGLARYSPVGFQTYGNVFWDYSALSTEVAQTVSATTSACYVDGVGLQSASHAADAWNNGSYTGIGGRHWQSHSYRAVGDFYCVRFYNRALSAAEIAANYAIDKARFNLP